MRRARAAAAGGATAAAAVPLIDIIDIGGGMPVAWRHADGVGGDAAALGQLTEEVQGSPLDRTPRPEWPAPRSLDVLGRCPVPPRYTVGSALHLTRISLMSPLLTPLLAVRSWQDLKFLFQN